MCVRFMTKRFITEYSSGEMGYNHFTFVDNEIAYFDVLDTCYKVRIFWDLAWKTKIYLQESCWVKHLYCILRNFQVFSSEHVLSSSFLKVQIFLILTCHRNLTLKISAKYYLFHHKFIESLRKDKYF